MAFLKHLLIAIAILVVGAVLHVTSAPASSNTSAWLRELYFLFGAIGAQMWLFTSAISLRHRRLPRFDMLVASELIVALGVLSLIIGIFIAIVFALRGTEHLQQFTFDSMRPFLMPFADGLFAAGFAPILAATLRQIEVLKYGIDGDDESSKDELESLNARIREVSAALNNLVSACERGQMIFEKAALTFNKSVDVYESAAADIQSSLRTLGDAATSQSGRLTNGFDAVGNSLGPFEKSLAQSLRAVDGLTEATHRYKGATEEGVTLLEGLRKLIASVERFIRPDR